MPLKPFRHYTHSANKEKKTLDVVFMFVRCAGYRISNRKVMFIRRKRGLFCGVPCTVPAPLHVGSVPWQWTSAQIRLSFHAGKCFWQLADWQSFCLCRSSHAAKGQGASPGSYYSWIQSQFWGWHEMLGAAQTACAADPIQDLKTRQSLDMIIMRNSRKVP